jgi:hypothetical protein
LAGIVWLVFEASNQPVGRKLLDGRKLFCDELGFAGVARCAVALAV